MVLPIHDSNPTRRRPIVTYLLIAANVIAFVLSPVVATTPIFGDTSAAAVCDEQAFFDHYAAIPKELTSGTELSQGATGQVGQDAQGRVGCVVASPPPYDKTPWVSALTAMFLHGGWLHLLGNMLYLFIFGNNIEDRMGRLRYLGFYLLSGFVATYGFAFADPSSTTTLIGASGAIAGVLGAYLVLYPKARIMSLLPFFFFIPLRLPAWAVLGSWFVLQYFYAQGAAVSSAGSVAYLAHVVGFVFGALLAIPLIRGTRPPPGRRRRRPAAA